jgi:hypothetical protein
LEDLVAFVIELAANGMVDEQLLEFELAWLGLRQDIFDKMKVSFFGFGVLGVARHCDVATGAGFVEGSAKFTPVEEPALEFGDGRRGGRSRFKLIEQRRKFVPITGIDFFRHKGAFPVRWQFSKRQQIHGTKNGAKMEKRNGGRAWSGRILRAAKPLGGCGV